MGKNLIIKGADFSENAVSLPEIVELQQLSPNGYITLGAITDGTTVYDNINWSSSNAWERFKAELDLTNYKYTSEAFAQGTGTGLLCACIVDTNGVIIKSFGGTTRDGKLWVESFSVNSDNYPTASYVAYCVSTSPLSVRPKLIKEKV